MFITLFPEIYLHVLKLYREPITLLEHRSSSDVFHIRFFNIVVDQDRWTILHGSFFYLFSKYVEIYW